MSNRKLLPDGPLFTVFQRYLPFRPPAWRYLRACQLVEQGEPLSSDLDDEQTLLAAQFLKAIKACTTDAERALVAEQFSAIHRAWKIYQTDSPDRWLLEARLLTGEPLEVVARLSTLPLDVVRGFHELFFHVHDRLQAELAILKGTVGKLIARMTDSDTAAILRLLGYLGGLDLLEASAKFVLDRDVDLDRLSPNERQLAESVQRFLWILGNQLKVAPGPDAAEGLPDALQEERQRKGMSLEEVVAAVNVACLREHAQPDKVAEDVDQANIIEETPPAVDLEQGA